MTRDFPALKSLNLLPNNLPLQLTSFIWREREMSAANRLLSTNLLGAAEALRKVIDSSMTKVEQEEYEKEISTLHSMLGEEEFRKQWDKGTKMTMEDAIVLAQAV